MRPVGNKAQKSSGGRTQSVRTAHRTGCKLRRKHPFRSDRIAQAAENRGPHCLGGVDAQPPRQGDGNIGCTLTKGIGVAAARPLHSVDHGGMTAEVGRRDAWCRLQAHRGPLGCLLCRRYRAKKRISSKPWRSNPASSSKRCCCEFVSHPTARRATRDVGRRQSISIMAVMPHLPIYADIRNWSRPLA
jgi:hypothetical protein